MITGAGGFLGSHLSRTLITQTSHSVFAVSSQQGPAVARKILDNTSIPLSREPNLTTLSNKQLFESDFLKPGDIIINCAFPWRRSGAELAEGLAFQRELFRKARQSGVNTTVNVSSQSVYPAHRDVPANEDGALDLDSTYAVAKYATELLAQEILPSPKSVSVRMGSLIGQGYEVRIVNRLLSQAITQRKIHLENGNQRFSFLDVRDACRALILIGERGGVVGTPVVNIGTESTVTLRQIALTIVEAVRDRYGFEVEIEEQISESENSEVSPKGTLNCDTAKTIYNFVAKISIRESIYWIAEQFADGDTIQDVSLKLNT